MRLKYIKRELKMTNMEERTAPEEAAPSSGSNTRNNNDLNLRKDGGDVKENRIILGGVMTLKGPKFSKQSAFIEGSRGEEFELKIERGAVDNVDGQLWIGMSDANVILESAGCDDELLGAMDSFYFSFKAIGNEDSSISLDISTSQARKLRDVLSGYLQAHEARLALEDPIEILVS
jgi:hypothetical protein